MTETIKLSDLQPDDRNANKGSERGTYMIRRSLEKLGAGRSILLDKNGRIIAGNKTAESAADVGLDDVIVVRTQGRQLVAVMREDLDLDDPTGMARELAYADNRTGQVSLDWDAGVLAEDIAGGVDLSDWFHGYELDAMLDDDAPDETPTALAPEEARATLAARFIVPPFSVLDARQGYWQERKRAWLALGIESEVGRGSTPGTRARSDNPTYREIGHRKSGTLGAIAPNEGGENGILARTGKYAVRPPNATPGGSPRDAATLGKDGKTIRGDGKGRPLKKRRGGRMALETSDTIQRLKPSADQAAKRARQRKAADE